MAESRYYCDRLGSIDGISPTLNLQNLGDLGVLFIGANKTIARRMLLTADISASVPISGRVVTVADTLTDAYLITNCFSIIEEAGANKNGTIQRHTRDDWDHLTATFNQYKSGSNWTTAGGDMDPPPPASVAFVAPAAIGEKIYTGLVGLVRDALDNWSGRMHIRFKLDDEAADFLDRIYAHDFGATELDRPILVIEYLDPIPTPLDTPRVTIRSGRTQRGARPAHPARAARGAAAARPARS